MQNSKSWIFQFQKCNQLGQLLHTDRLVLYNLSAIEVFCKKVNSIREWEID